MPTTTIPLYTAPSQRNVLAVLTKDGRCISGFFTVVPNEILNTKSVFFEKRAGFESLAAIASGSNGRFIHYDDVNGVYVMSFETGGVQTIYTFDDPDIRNCNSVGGNGVSRISQVSIGGEIYYLITVSGTRGYYLPFLTLGSTKTFTADTTSGNPTLTNVSSTSGIYVGQTLSGTGIPATARVKSFVAGTSVTMGSDSDTDVNATATNSGITVTRSDVAIIMSTSAPGGTVGLTEMDGYVFSAATDEIRNSSVNDLNTWSVNNSIKPNVETDNIVTITRYRGYIVSFGSSSIEFFYNAGNSFGSVLSRNNSLFIGFGIIGNIAQTADYVFFIGGESAGGGYSRGIYTLNGFSPEKVSTATIDKIISSSTSPTLEVFSAYGKTLLHVSGGSLSTLDYSFLYCLETKEWFESGFPFYMRMANSLGPISGVAVNSTSGKLYNVNQSSPVYQDDGSAFTMTFQTQPYSLNKGKGFVINSVELLADTQASGSSTLSISGDDYATFQSPGSFNLTRTTKRVHRCGYYRNHAIFKVEDSGNQAWRGQALIVDWEPCST